MILSVEPLSGKTIRLECTSGYTIGMIKAEIQDREGVPPRLQRIFYAGRQLEDDQMLCEYGIEASSTVYLVTQLGSFCDMNIFVARLNDKTISFEVQSYETIEKIKAKIQERKGIPADQQHLTFHDIQLEDGHRLSDYGIQHKSILRLRSTWWWLITTVLEYISLFFLIILLSICLFFLFILLSIFEFVPGAYRLGGRNAAPALLNFLFFLITEILEIVKNVFSH